MKTPEQWLEDRTFCRKTGVNTGDFTVYGIEAIQQDAIASCNLYAFFPNVHGPVSLFTVATSRDLAIKQINAYIEAKLKAAHPNNLDMQAVGAWVYFTNGHGGGELEVVPFGGCTHNHND